MSSSNLSNQRYFDQKGFKIPNSIDEIWGSSTAGNSQNFFDKVNNTNNKLSKLSKVNIVKAGLQRKSYLWAYLKVYEMKLINFYNILLYF